MKKFPMKQPAKTAVEVTLDNIDTANQDLGYIRSMVDILLTIDRNKQLDGLRSGTVSSLCVTAIEKIEDLEFFIKDVYDLQQARLSARDTKAA